MNIWKKITILLENSCKLYLLTVVESTGSAPGRKGFKMIVSDNGQLFGSIGGGVMEFNMVEKARDLLKQKEVEQCAIKQIHKGSSAQSSGMICSGSQVIGFNYLCRDDLIMIYTIVKSIVKSAQLVEFSNAGIKLIDSGNEQCFQYKSANIWHYSEWVNIKLKAHIFGAGHVSVPTSLLLSQIGFDVFLYDNRDGINTFNQNFTVKEKGIIDYCNISKEVKIQPQDYVLLMTHKFTEDKLILSQLLSSNLHYLGVLGSKNKIKIMFDALIKQGFSSTQLHKVYAPVGVSINSQTTDEIAVSIVAEIIKIKNA